MKKIYRLLLTLPLAAMSWACSDNVIDDLSGTYGDIERYTFITETTGETQKLKKGLKYLDMEFADAANNTFNLRVVSREWALQPGTYTPMASVGDEPVANTFYGFVANGNLARGAITEGELTVTLIDGTYYISGLLSGSDSHRYVVNYRGPIEFVAGVDDPEPSGYTVMLKVDPLTVTDPATWQPVPVPGMSKYTLAISDPEGKDAAFLEAANREGMTLAELAGTYTIAGSPAEPWLIDNGWLVPDYGMAGGAYVVAPDGEKQYIVQGTVRIEAATGTTGETLYSFTGENLSFITMAGGNGTTNLGIRFAQCLEKSGTELLDLSFQSQVLGREVKYSVLLPKSFDGTKEFPVLYMLHGATGNSTDWLAQGAMASHTGNVATEMVIVSPQATFDGFDSFYVDNYQDKGLAYETFFTTEFMPAIEAMYKGNGKRGIAGLSMGGFGSLYYGLKYTGQFSGIYACSPALAMEGAGNIFDMVWTPVDTPFVIEIGTEDFLYESATWFNEAMKNSPMLGNYTYIERPGAHDWAFWSACAPKIVKFFDTVFSK